MVSKFFKILLLFTLKSITHICNIYFKSKKIGMISN
nr:MAG TPA: Initiation control protein YabA [Bacteriophage sp.]